MDARAANVSVVNRIIGGVVWGDLDAEALSAMSAEDATGFAAALFSGLKRANIVSQPTVSQPFGGPQESVWKVYYALRARGNSSEPPVAPPVEFEVVEPEPPSAPPRATRLHSRPSTRTRKGRK